MFHCALWFPSVLCNGWFWWWFPSILRCIGPESLQEVLQRVKDSIEERLNSKNVGLGSNLTQSFDINEPWDETLETLGNKSPMNRENELQVNTTWRCYCFHNMFEPINSKRFLFDYFSWIYIVFHHWSYQIYINYGCGSIKSMAFIRVAMFLAYLEVSPHHVNDMDRSLSSPQSNSSSVNVTPYRHDWA